MTTTMPQPSTCLAGPMADETDGLVLLDQAGRPSFVNTAAGAILSAGDGLTLLEGAFVTARSPQTVRLRTMIGDAIAASRALQDRPGGQMLVGRPSGLRPYVVRVAPGAEGRAAGPAIACTIQLHDPAAALLPSTAALGAIFALSEREADLAVQLVRCAGLAAAAANAGMAINTARNHLQSIFRKTGAANQSEAIQLFGRLF